MRSGELLITLWMSAGAVRSGNVRIGSASLSAGNLRSDCRTIGPGKGGLTAGLATTSTVADSPSTFPRFVTSRGTDADIGEVGARRSGNANHATNPTAATANHAIQRSVARIQVGTKAGEPTHSQAAKARNPVRRRAFSNTPRATSAARTRVSEPGSGMLPPPAPVVMSTAQLEVRALPK
jgi:hypothetical protein